MNRLFKHIITAVLCTMIIVPVYGMENEQVEQVPAVWYKKRSVKVGAAVTGAAAVYALALHMGKVALPMLVAGWFVKTAHDASIVNAETNNVDSAGKRVEIVVVEAPVKEQNTEVLIVEIPQQNVKIVEQDIQQQVRNFMDNAWRKINLLKDKVGKEATDSAARIKSEDLMYHV